MKCSIPNCGKEIDPERVKAIYDPPSPGSGPPVCAACKSIMDDGPQYADEGIGGTRDDTKREREGRRGDHGLPPGRGSN